MNEGEFVFKIVICGDASVGKTSLIKSYIEKTFELEYKPTLGCDLFKKDIDINFEEKRFHCRLVLWDIAGQDRYEHVRSLYFQGCVGAFLVYDCTRPKTFENITNTWLNDLIVNVKEEISFILIGNKIDLEDAQLISKEKGKELADEINAVDFIETSAKTGVNVEDSFKTLVIQVLKKLGALY